MGGRPTSCTSSTTTLRHDPHAPGRVHQRAPHRLPGPDPDVPATAPPAGRPCSTGAAAAILMLGGGSPCRRQLWQQLADAPHTRELQTSNGPNRIHSGRHCLAGSARNQPPPHRARPAGQCPGPTSWTARFRACSDNHRMWPRRAVPGRRSTWPVAITIGPGLTGGPMGGQSVRHSG